MALFGGKKKNLLQTIKTSGWRNDDERLQVVEELKESNLKISEAVPLLIHKDTAIRQIAIDQV
ncbi:MAG: hypothetical protein QGG40_05175, partial [Myxococcota bacterium]|nr:hypothetical protein [Myxococcota bacterium]